MVDLFFQRELQALSRLSDSYKSSDLGMHLANEMRQFIGDRWNGDPINVIKSEVVAVSARWNSRYSIPDKVITRALANPSLYTVHEMGSSEDKLAVIVINSVSN